MKKPHLNGRHDKLLKISTHDFLIALCAFSSMMFALAGIAGADISCSFEASCSSTALLRVENDTGGYVNAHAQLPSNNSYAYALCCSSAGQTLGTSCSGNFSNLTRLSDVTNAHMQDPNNASLPTIYPNTTCISANATITCSLQVNSCSAGYDCVASMGSSEGNNYTNAHIGDCSYYALKICCSTNSPPPQVNLTYPNLTSTVTDRYTLFNWTAVADPDSDAVHYEFNLTSPSGLGCFGFINSNVPDNNLTSTTELCTDLDHSSGSYSWLVRACDPTACGPWSDTAIFNVTSVNAILLLNGTVGFGTMDPGASNNTTTNNPLPFVVENDGNIRINVSARGNDSLFDTYPGLNDSSFQFMAGVNESGAFNATRSVTSFTNVSNASQVLIATMLYLPQTDGADIEFKVTVPAIEVSSTKDSIIIVQSSPDLPS